MDGKLAQKERKTALFRLRKAAGLTQEELAELVGSYQAQIGRLESGETRLNVDWIMKLSAALNCSPAEFLPGPGGLAEAGAVYEAPPDGTRMLAALLPDQPEAFWMRARSDALNLAGVLPGDYLICVPAPEPKAGDQVIVTIAERDGGGSTVLRELIKDARGHLILRAVSSNTRHELIAWDPEDPATAILGRIVYRIGGAGPR